MPTAYEIREGARFSFGGGWDGTVTKVSSPNCIQFTPDDSGSAFLRFEIDNSESGCVFRLIDRMASDRSAEKMFPDEPIYRTYQPGGIGTHWSGVIAGYHGFVDQLEQYVAGKKANFDYDRMCKDYTVLLDKWHNPSTDGQ